MKIAFVISSMNAGGAERAAALMLNHWAANGDRVTLVTFDTAGSVPFYELDGRVQRRFLAFGHSSGMFGRLGGFLGRVRDIRRTLRSIGPDVVIASIDQTNVMTVLATRGMKVPVVCIEHVDPDRYAIGAGWRLLRLIVYALPARVVAVSAGVLRKYPPYVQKRGRVIPNPVVVPPCGTTEIPAQRNGRRVVSAMGRLAYQKGFDLLLRAFAMVADQFPQWDLVIWGEGPERARLEQLRAGLRVEPRVQMPGVTDAPARRLRQSDLFVFPSRFEGFGIALGEAMACGLPVISFDCPCGPSDLIINGENGILVPPEDVVMLARAMSRLMNDEQERKRLGENAVAVAGRFGMEKIMAAWNGLLEEITHGQQ